MAGYIGSKSSVTQVDGYNQAEADAEFVNDPNSVISVSGSNVGIGTSSPTQKLTIEGAAGYLATVQENSANKVRFQMYADATQVALVSGYNTTAKPMTFFTGGSEAMRIDSSGNLLAGRTTTPPTAGAKIAIGSTGDTAVQITKEGVVAGRVMAVTTGLAFGVDGADGATERMRIDSSGNLLVGKTSSSTLTAGNELRAGGLAAFTRSGSYSLNLNRLSSDGDIAVFQKDNSTVGSIGTQSGKLQINGTSGTGFFLDTVQVLPKVNGSLADNQADLGSNFWRWDDIYATNGTIQTSDRNEKQDIEVLSDAETRVAQACKGLLRKFRWQDAVAEKGDDARIHFGIIAQDLQDAFAAEGLDAGRYAMFISSTWWETQTEVPAVEAVAEVLDDDGNVVTEAVEAKEAYTRTDTYETLEEAPEGATERTRLGVRYPELLAFIIGAM